jgi:hypothetical protein
MSVEPDWWRMYGARANEGPTNDSQRYPFNPLSADCVQVLVQRHSSAVPDATSIVLSRPEADQGYGTGY